MHTSTTMVYAEANRSSACCKRSSSWPMKEVMSVPSLKVFQPTFKRGARRRPPFAKWASALTIRVKRSSKELLWIFVDAPPAALQSHVVEIGGELVDRELAGSKVIAQGDDLVPRCPVRFD